MGRTTSLTLLLLFCILSGTASPALSQYEERSDTISSFYTINGVVKDRKTKRGIGYVSIQLPGTNTAVIANEEGVFSLKIGDSVRAEKVLFSHIGYSNQQISVDEVGERFLEIYLSPVSKQLKEIKVLSPDPFELVREAVGKIGKNYALKDNLLTGFYRETIRKRKEYVNVSEAVIHVNKSSYLKDAWSDRVQVYKGRSLLSPKLDTLLVKFAGGPNLSCFLDIVKNPDLILGPAALYDYLFSMEAQEMIDERLHYVVAFKPKPDRPFALYHGKLFIDRETLAFSRAEFSLSMANRQEVTRLILLKKPPRMHFKPEEVSYIVSYKQSGGTNYLNYICSTVRFKCDWKRRLFSTGYTIVSEMVVTDIRDEDYVKISRSEAFNKKKSLSDSVMEFFDPGFWEDYNIIEPTESLERAVGKLRIKN